MIQKNFLNTKRFLTLGGVISHNILVFHVFSTLQLPSPFLPRFFSSHSLLRLKVIVVTLNFTVPRTKTSTMEGIVEVLRSTLVPETQKAAEAKLDEVCHLPMSTLDMVY